MVLHHIKIYIYMYIKLKFFLKNEEIFLINQNGQTKMFGQPWAEETVGIIWDCRDCVLGLF